MAGQSHRIGELRLDLRAPDPATADIWGRAAQAMAEDRLLPLIEAAFDRVAPQGVRHLDRIVLDLGRIGPDPEALVAALEQALRSALGDAGPSPAPPQDGDPAAGAVDLIAAYLTRGGLSLPGPGAALRAAWAAVAALPPPGLARALARLVPTCVEPSAARRLLASAPDGLLRQMARALAGLADLPPPPAGGGGAGGRDANDDEVLAAIAALARAPGDPERRTALAGALDAPAPRGTPPVAAVGSGPPPPLPANLPAGPPAAAFAAPPRAQPRSTGADAPEVPSLAVPAAGLVILHPYLSPFFDRLGLLSGPGRFADAAARATAVRLAQRLATGEDTAPEADCVLAKLLCGLDPAEALWPGDPARPAPDRLAAEAERLLAAVIGHWAKLGRTSPEGLREAFLRRPGLVQRRDDGWLLRVERRGTDILLDSLPWTIGLVRTPFMAAVLRVDWR
jgi:hypothetical protein